MAGDVDDDLIDGRYGNALVEPERSDQPDNVGGDEKVVFSIAEFDHVIGMGSGVTPDQSIPTVKQRKMLACEELIEYQFRDRQLLESALTHASSADSRVVSNERLEFLGDAILGMVICENLFTSFPHLLEGELTKIKSVVVSRRTCARVSRKLEMERYMFVGRGMVGQAAIPQKIMADVFESLIGAVYLDGGLEAARPFILRHLQEEIDKAASGNHGGNYKSMLQQFSQREFNETPVYETLDERGPDHAKSFKVVARIGDRRFPPAWGESKKEAEQRAAYNAMNSISSLTTSPND